MSNPLCSWQERRDLPPLLERVQSFTMVPHDSLVDLARQVRTVVQQGISGDLVECGAWKGGASFLMAEMLRQAGVRDRKVWMFDSFEGIRPPEEIDGPAAHAWAENKDSRWHHDNLRVSVEWVEQAARDLGLAPWTRIVKGWFDKTLPQTRASIGPIAILRVDADWHASVACCLENLYDQVVSGGFVIFDDYYTYDGCAIAVHEFLGRRSLAHRIESVGVAHHTAAVFRKGNVTWKWMEQMYLLEQDLTAALGTLQRFVLVDQETLRAQLLIRDRAIPFLEREGQFWGPPANDQAAVAELHRQQTNGVRFIAFAWPAFWYLDHYPALHRHLQAHARMLVRNERVILFELQP